MTRRLLSRCGHWVFAVAAALLFAGCATQLEDQKRIAIEFLPDQIIDRGDVFARIRPIRARTIGLQVAELFWKERKPNLFEDLLDLLRHLASQQFGGEDSFPVQCFRHSLPVIGGNRLHLDLDVIGFGTGALDRGFDLALFDIN